VILTATNVHDSNVFEELVDPIEPIKCPKKLHADTRATTPRSAGRR
jgi:hypothetical protein